MVSIKTLAREAIGIQNACNLSGLVHGWSRAVTNLREALEEETGKVISTEEFNQHPINVLWASKLSDLAGIGPGGTEYSDAYVAVRKLSE